MKQQQRIERSRKWLIVFLLLTTISAFGVAIASIYEYMTLLDMPATASTEEIPAETRQLLGQISIGAFMPRLLFFLITAVVFLIWTYRLFDGASSVLKDDSLNNPGWVVSFFIIPFMNFFLPLLSFLDLSKKQSVQRFGHKERKKSALVISWWMFFLFSLLVSMTTGFFVTEDATVGMLRNDALSTSISEFTLTIAGVLAVLVVNMLTRQQEAIIEEEST
ncbi:DUF4328 domain-containing protein [Geomicrobium sp. JCM 19039]|uniref:DUF4328 domain-containing protein n=1 Tax=Geomicrobium sp. JCM 19039 TaxID=1460636 RepID=UPI00045F172A|nr:DUF4328 domain-containing protein [Geomicrobium sp. JCM 19039]GAK11768.1 hypothetical protein JCM19039_1483 [Geomicrobium sp. JCM 19039]